MKVVAKFPVNRVFVPFAKKIKKFKKNLKKYLHFFLLWYIIINVLEGKHKKIKKRD